MESKVSESTKSSIRGKEKEGIEEKKEKVGV